MAAAAAQPSPQPSVTTTWLPDAFPNAAPKVLDRHTVVEVNTPSLTPSVLLGVYDVENDPLTVDSFAQPMHGQAALNSDGTFTYTPIPDFAGEDEFAYTVSDGRGGQATAKMLVSVIRPSGRWSTTRFTDLSEVVAAGEPLRFARAATVPRAVDWNGDGKIDLLIGVEGAVWCFLNEGSSTSPKFTAGTRIQANGRDIELGRDRLAMAFVDLDGDGRKDLVVVPAGDRKPRFYKNLAPRAGEPRLAEAVLLRTRRGQDLVANDIRADFADWNGDGFPDLITGHRAGPVQVVYHLGTAGTPAFGDPTAVLDAEGRLLEGAYNLNVRMADVNQDGIPDLVDSYNWGNINFRINSGTPTQPRLPQQGRFDVTGPSYRAIDLHALCDGAIVDLADFNGDGVIDLVMGGEIGGTVRMAYGQSARLYLQELETVLSAHPEDLGGFLTDPDAASRMKSLLGALYDYTTLLANPRQKNILGQDLARLLTKYPQYFRLQKQDRKTQPGIPSLAVQMWLAFLMTDDDNPMHRRLVADTAGLTGGYRKLVEESGLIYADNHENPRGADAIYDWVRTIPRELYPGNCITAADWLGGTTFLVRAHAKNTFNGSPLQGGEYGFGPDARPVIGARGSENWFMTVVHHEACHDLDAWVRQSPAWTRRWGQVLVRAGGPDMRADPLTGWFSWDLTKEHFREANFWDGRDATWENAWKQYWNEPPGREWRDYGFMRGNIAWFYGAPQESLATQGNQHWNSTEGRLQVAMARWKRGYPSALTEVLFFLDLWSVGLNKVKFYETDDACHQVIAFAQLRRTPQGHINRIDLGDRSYEFEVDEQGVVTRIVLPDE